jgi:deoxyribonuclease-1
MRLIVIAGLLSVSAAVTAAPQDFGQAKRLLREHVYQDQNLTDAGDFYCGCQWKWVGKSGGSMDQDSCGFVTDKMADRASRLEWEHVMPISAVGRQRQCWRNGGRQNCQRTDPVYNQIEADMHNLVPSIGTANALRSNTNYGMVTGRVIPMGACTTKIGTTIRAVEPRNEVKGQSARITFYMADRYNMRLGDKQQKVLIAWDRAYPVSAWELERDSRIAKAMGRHNPFVTGERKWVLGYTPHGSASNNVGVKDAAFPAPAPRNQQVTMASVASASVYGNKRSGVYHLPQGCPSYDQISTKNRVQFNTEAAARASGYRKAGNCL